MCVGKTPASLRGVNVAVLAKNEVLYQNIAVVKEARNAFLLIVDRDGKAQLPRNMEIASVLMECNTFGNGEASHCEDMRKILALYL